MTVTPDKVEIFMPPHTIANKVTVGGPNAVSAQNLDRTDKQIVANLSAQYVDGVTEDLKMLDRALAKLEGSSASPAEDLQAFHDIVHEVRAMGGTFEYDLISSIGDQLYRMVDKFETAGPEQVDAIRVHLAGMQMVIKEKLQGDGGATGQALKAGLQKVYAKFS